jgi:hypothetical protein
MIIETDTPDGRIKRTYYHRPDPNDCWKFLKDEVEDSPERERVFEQVEEAFEELGESFSQEELARELRVPVRRLDEPIYQAAIEQAKEEHFG